MCVYVYMCIYIYIYMLPRRQEAMRAQWQASFIKASNYDSWGQASPGACMYIYIYIYIYIYAFRGLL